VGFYPADVLRIGALVILSYTAIMLGISRACNIYTIATACDLATLPGPTGDPPKISHRIFQFKMTSALDQTQIAACAAAYFVMFVEHLKNKKTW
jgi:hypothetical protein